MARSTQRKPAQTSPKLLPGSLIASAHANSPGRSGFQDRWVAHGRWKEGRQPRLAQETFTPLGGGKAQHQPVCKPDGICPTARPLDGGEINPMTSKDGGGNGLEAVHDLTV